MQAWPRIVCIIFIVLMLMSLEAGCQSQQTYRDITPTTHSPHVNFTEDKYAPITTTTPSLPPTTASISTDHPPETHRPQEQLLTHLHDMVAQQHYVAVLQMLSVLNDDDFTVEERTQLHFFATQCFLALGLTHVALDQWLPISPTTLISAIDIANIQATLYLRKNMPLKSAVHQSLLPSDNILAQSAPSVWERFQLATTTQLHRYSQKGLDEQQKAWLALANISRQAPSRATQELNYAIAAWR